MDPTGRMIGCVRLDYGGSGILEDRSRLPMELNGYTLSVLSFKLSAR